MPITSSAKKAHRQSLRKRTDNNVVKRIMKEAVKSFKAEAATDPKKAETLLPGVYKAIDKAAKKGVIKPNTANRKKSAVANTLKSE